MDGFTHDRGLRVGVIGGGQLARMMISPALDIGIELSVLAESAGMPASLATTAVGDFRDVDTVLRFASAVDVITFDHEHVPTNVLRAMVEAGVTVHPSPHALAIAQDKILMRQTLEALGLPVPNWAAVETPAQLDAFLADHGGIAVVKTPRGGYDGKGVRVVSSSAEVTDWFTALTPEAGALLVEERVTFRRELAQLVARRPSGELAAWPVVHTLQSGGICAEVIAPAPGSSGPVADECVRIARAVAEGIGVTGVLAVELFETDDDRILINELAMRPHNSGHWTQDGSRTSQFEQHLRAVLDLPLGDTTPTAPETVMVNILGGPANAPLSARYRAVLDRFPHVNIHGYGKPSRAGRKVGHVNACGDDLGAILADARAAAAMLTDEWPE